MASELEELVDFLSHDKVEVRRGAAEIVQGLTGTPEGVHQLSTQGEKLMPALLARLGDEEEIVRLSAEALINLSAHEGSLLDVLLKTGAVTRIMQLLGWPQFAYKRLLVMLLANVTQQEEGAKELLQEGEEDAALRGLYLMRLIHHFVQSSTSQAGTPPIKAVLPAVLLSVIYGPFEKCSGEDVYEHVAAILVNVTRTQSGRQLILSPKRGLFRRILPQIESASIIRRQGVAGTVRNCCFEASTQLPALLTASQFLWPALLLPLAGPKAYTAEDCSKMPKELAIPLGHPRGPEEDAIVRREAAEALYLIALQEGGRRALWAVNAPRILQIGYEDEEDPQVVEAYEKIGSLLVTESGAAEDTAVEP